MKFDNFKNKKILVTGHTGFKGSWLSLWLSSLGGKVIGLSKDVPSKNSLYNFIKKDFYKDIRADISNLKNLKKIIKEYKPEYIFHLAAQPLVSKSNLNPIETFNINCLGSLHILDAVKSTLSDAVVIMITSDKVYNNKEWIWGYRENDELGGIDPYSASKSMAEIGINSYVKTFFSNSDKFYVATVRAGNVIGGGDWSENRIVPDCIKSVYQKKTLLLRNPFSTRPWQHVLEPLSGYLYLAQSIEKLKLHNQSFNFGPDSLNQYTVLDLVKMMSSLWSDVKWSKNKKNNHVIYESKLLTLNCDKAQSYLGWRPVLNFVDNVRFTVDWYKQFQKNKNHIREFTVNQILEYQNIRNQK